MVGFHRVGDWGQPRLGFRPVIDLHPVDDQGQPRLGFCPLVFLFFFLLKLKTYAII